MTNVSWDSTYVTRLGLNDGVNLWTFFKICPKANIFFDMGNKRKKCLEKSFKACAYICYTMYLVVRLSYKRSVQS